MPKQQTIKVFDSAIEKVVPSTSNCEAFTVNVKAGLYYMAAYRRNVKF